MKNPNASAALAALAVSAGCQWLCAHFLHVGLAKTYADAVSGGFVVFVLWVGRAGVKGAALRVWNGAKATTQKAGGAAKSAWAGSTPAA